MILTFKGYIIEGTPKEINEFLNITDNSIEIISETNGTMQNSIEEFYKSTGCNMPQELKDGRVGYR